MTPNDDQTFAQIRDSIPTMWWSIYQGCLAVGFDAPTSMSLLKTFILGTSCKGIILPDSPEHPKSDNPG